MTSEWTGLPLKESEANMRALYAKCGVLAGKVLHQGRGEAQRALDDDGVDLDAIKRFARYIHSEQMYVLTA